VKVLDLFSGIGGFSLGLERAGMTTVAFCEVDPFCRRVLAKHWPEVPCYDDVRTLTGERLAADGISVDVICGGFPCQDISVAGNGAGLAGERSGLWRDYARLIGEIRPRFVVVENVAALLFRGLGDVLGDLAALGYDAEWHCIPAAAVGAPHRRDRLWIVGYPHYEGQPAGAKHDEASELPGVVADTEHGRLEIGRRVEDVGEDHDTNGILGTFGQGGGIKTRPLVYANSPSVEGCQLPLGIIAEHAEFGRASWWEVEPDVGRVADGVPSRVDRIRGLGNAVVPQIPELIGRAIMRATA
jgi:DNA (cytosine-5)-methyltransferase 1